MQKERTHSNVKRTSEHSEQNEIKSPELEQLLSLIAQLVVKRHLANGERKRS